MPLDHERLDIYQLALDFLVFANEVIERLRWAAAICATSSRGRRPRKSPSAPNPSKRRGR
jgi:hypothetical protein